VEPPAAIVPLWPWSVVNVMPTSAWEFWRLQTPCPAQVTIVLCAEAVDAPNTSAPIPTATARMTRRIE
jgi:hypothetical protein